MGEWLLVGASALWLGILTSISPCPLATNVAAISFVGRRVGNPRQVFVAGLLYTLGRSLAYLVLGALLVGSLLSVPHVSYALQKYMNKILGPVLILVGMFLLEMLSINISGSGIGEAVRRRVEAWGVWGAGAATNGGRTVVLAVAEGRRAAEHIGKYLADRLAATG